MNHPKVEFQLNVWQDLALKYSTGRLCANSKQPSKMFTTVDGRVFFLSLAESEKLEALKLMPGDLFSCAKVERHYNGRKWQEFECSRIGEPEVIEERTLPTPAPRKPVSEANQPVNDTFSHASKPALPVAMPSRPRTVLEDCLISAVAAAKSAEEWGAANGYTIRFTSEDIRAMAITTCIAKREESRHAA